MESTTQPTEAAGVAAAAAEREYEALVRGAGWRLMKDRITVRVTGADRISFLNGMCSNNIRDLQPGGVLPALLLTEHAHIVADMFVWAEPEAFILEIDRGLWPGARAHLEKFLIADDVEFEEFAASAVLAIEGPAASAIAGQLVPAAAGLPPWRFAESDAIKIANLPRFEAPAFTLLTERDRAAAMVAELRRFTDVVEVSANALEVLRIEHGRARVGIDTGKKTLALEARLGRAISPSKGCYLGQETVERVSAHGALKRKLMGLRVGGGRLPLPGAAVMLEDREVGRLTSRALSPRRGGVGLAILNHRAWEAGTAVTIADSAGESPATVADLPFK